MKTEIESIGESYPGLHSIIRFSFSSCHRSILFVKKARLLPLELIPAQPAVESKCMRKVTGDRGIANPPF
jgi:hypothetical protein